MPVIGPRCHELRVRDRTSTWRVIYRDDADAVLVVDLFSKKTRATPKAVVERALERLRAYDKHT